MRWLFAVTTTVIAVFTVALLLGHRYVPNSPGNAGSLLETFLPWLGLAVPALVILAVVRKSWYGVAAAGLVLVVWLGLFGRLIVPGKGGGPHNLRVLTHNVGDSDPQRTAHALLDAGADLVALEELSETALASYRSALGAAYPYMAARGTVALWSKHPLAAASNVDIGMGWTRALRATVQTPQGPVAVYVAHLASVRVGESGFSSDQRDRTITELGGAIAAEKLPRVLLLGDLNGSAYDRGLAPLTYGLDSAQAAGGFGFGFSWPAAFPMARIDHILVRGIHVADARVLPRTGSDHRPVSADLLL
jgi:vancomycin resistance protein VanJ